MKALLLSSLILLGSVSANASEATGSLPIIGDLLGTTVIPTILTAVTSSDYNGKEIVMAAKADAQDFLAGENATNNLVKAISLLKNNVPELSEATDLEIVQIIATLE